MADPNEKLLPPGANKADYQTDAGGNLKLSNNGKLMKKRKPQGSRVPEGHKLIKFYLPGEDHDALTQMADDEDRSPEDFARVLTRRGARSHPSHPKYSSGRGSQQTQS